MDISWLSLSSLSREGLCFYSWSDGNRRHTEGGGGGSSSSSMSSPKENVSESESSITFFTVFFGSEKDSVIDLLTGTEETTKLRFTLQFILSLFNFLIGEKEDLGNTDGPSFLSGDGDIEKLNLLIVLSLFFILKNA